MRLTRLVTILLFLSQITVAQNVRSTLSGRVVDQTGAAVPEASVVVTNTETNQGRTVRANGSGDYIAPELMPGPYVLSIEQVGFQRSVVRGIVLETGQEVRVDVTLKVGAVSESIEVQASAPLVNADTAAVGGVVENRKIVELPLNGRNYLQLAVLQPNVLPAAQNSSNATRGGLNIAGGSEASNLFIKDGVANNSASAGANYTPILDTIREFKVLTGTYPAEYGRMSGAQIVVTSRSGTNAFHGSAWEFLRNSAFDARNFFAPTKPSFHRNQFGGVLGGPVRKDKTFFFVGYEGQKFGQQEASRIPVPPMAFRTGDFSSLSTALKDPRNGNAPFPGNRIPTSAINPAGSGLMALYPTPNASGSANYNVSTTDVLRGNQFMTRGDHRFSEHDSISLIYEWQHSEETDPLKGVAIPGWGVIGDTGTQHAVASWTHIFTPSLLAEARTGYSRQKILNLQQDYAVSVVGSLGIQGLTDVGKIPYNDGAPSVALSGYNSIGGGTSNPQGRGENSFHDTGALTWIHGNHVMKFGVDYLRFLYNSFNVGTGRGGFKFDGRYTGNSAADLLLGTSYTATRNLGDPFTNVIAHAFGTYFQDDWRITPRLTLNFGLRYELFPPIRERLNIIASFDTLTNAITVAGGQQAYLGPAGQLLLRDLPGVGANVYEGDHNNFAPRVGLAWRPFGDTKTVIRAGFGVFYNMQMTGNGVSQLSRSSPFRTNQTAGPFSYPVVTDVRDMFGATSATPVPPGIQKDVRTPYVNQWTFNVQREVARNLVAEVAYQGSEGHKLLYPWNINQAYPGTGTVASRRPYQGWSDITGGFVSSIANSNFNSLALRLERRFDNGLSVLASFLWSKSISNGSGSVATTDDSSPRRPRMPATSRRSAPWRTRISRTASCSPPCILCRSAAVSASIPGTRLLPL